jgi:alcohol dehydrogenase class IV
MDALAHAIEAFAMAGEDSGELVPLAYEIKRELRRETAPAN